MGKAIVVPDVVFSGVGNKTKVSCNTWPYNGYELESYAMNHTFHQGVAIFGNYAMHFDHNGEYFYVYDMVNKLQLASIRVQDPDTNRHGNTANFGTLRYDENDDFPLLYVSGNEDKEDGTDYIIKTVDVYRIQVSNNTWSVTKVQVIDFSQTNVTYANACFYGNNLVLVQTYPYEFSCPAVTHLQEGEVEVYNLTNEDLIEVHTRANYGMYDLVQGVTCAGKYLYFINSTYNGSTFKHYIDVTDLELNTLVGHYFVNEPTEIQQISYWENQNRFILFFRVGNDSKFIDFVRNT